MSEGLWIALLAASATLVGSTVTHLLSTRAANKQADRSERLQREMWQRSEVARIEDQRRKDALEDLAWTREQAKQQQQLRDARLRELWGHVTAARWQLLDALDRAPQKGHPPSESAGVSAESLPFHAVGQAYAVALIGLPDVRASAKAFYAATAAVQHALVSADQAKRDAEMVRWHVAYKALEVCVANAADSPPAPDAKA